MLMDHGSEGRRLSTRRLWEAGDIARAPEAWGVANGLPCSRTSLEGALYFRATRFAPVGDILETIGEQDRRDFRYRHFTCAIRADFHGRHDGAGQLGAHDGSFRPTNVGASKKSHPGSGACQSEKQELGKLSRSLCDSGSITHIVRLLSAGVEAKHYVD
jgi:hypothetical protein